MNDRVQNAELLKQLGDMEAAFVKTHDELAEAVKAANSQIKEQGDQVTELLSYKELIAKIEKKTEGLDGLFDQIKAIEQKQVALVDNGTNGGEFKSLGERFIESEGFKGVEGKASLAGGKIEMQIAGKAAKAITNAPLDNNQPLVQTQRLGGIVKPEDRRFTIRDLVAPGSTASNNIEYAKELVFTNNADYQVAEGDAKAESDITFELENHPVATIAHWIQASKQVLSDAPMLQSYIDGRMRYGLKLKEEAELLNGDGTAGNLDGLLPNATSYTGQAGDSKADQVRRAVHQVELSDYFASGIVMHPTDWLDIELSRDADEVYYLGGPANRAEARLWGLPVVTTQSIPVGQYMTGAFMVAAQIFDREEITVTMSEHDRDNFIKNMLTILCEERLALAIYRPASFVRSTFAS